ncbi:MAG: hypothetical protein K6F02_05195 [Prevotella sp.]|nr:hypothetical protein [Prevotella sp.]
MVTVRDAIVPTPYEKCEERLRIASPIYYETNAITVKTTEAKLIKMRIKTFGNWLYLKNPKYYVGELVTAVYRTTRTVVGRSHGKLIPMLLLDCGIIVLSYNSYRYLT